MPAPWTKGTDAATKVKDELESWMQSFLPGRPNVDKRLKIKTPKRELRRQPAPEVRIYTGYDDQPPTDFGATGSRVIEEFHRVTMDVIGDERTTGEDVLNAIASNIRQGLSDPVERAKLIAKGVYNIRQSAEALNVKDVVYTRPLTITCSTETYV